MNKTILVIDDDPGTLRLVTKTLEGAGYRTCQAFDGREGLERIHQQRPDLIILDVIMPEMDGFRFIRALKDSPGLESIPVLVLTAKTRLKEVFHLEGAGSYMVKPVVPVKLLERVATLLRLRTSRVILVADDDPGIRNLLRRRLTENGFFVTTASDGVSCIQAIDMHKPDLVILDIMMPGASGAKICALIKREKRTRLMPVIILTSKERFYEQEIMELKDADAFFNKPVRADELLRKAHELLET